MSRSTNGERSEFEARLSSVGGQADDEIDLAETALLLAALDRPRVPIERYRDHVAMLQLETAQEGTRRGAERSLESRLEALRAVVVEKYGYRGDRLTYDDLQNANLMRVIDRRKGLPVALGIVYIAVARHQGWWISGLNFPGPFPSVLGAGRHKGDRRSLRRRQDPQHVGLAPDAESGPRTGCRTETHALCGRLQPRHPSAPAGQYQAKAAAERAA